MIDRCDFCDHPTRSHMSSGCLRKIQIGANGFAPCPCVAPLPTPRCKASEGATGIDCELEAGHQGEHEGTHKSGGEHDGIGYDLFVRWPYQPWNIERGIAPHTEGVNT